MVANYYQDEGYRRYQGFRLLAIDGSKQRLPAPREVMDAFGTLNITNGKDSQPVGEHAHGLASVCYEVLNKIVIDCHLGGAHVDEVNLAVLHLQATQTNDLLLCNRGYASSQWLATGVKQQRHFVVRCSKGSFQTARQMSAGLGADSLEVCLKSSHDQRRAVETLGLPMMSLQVRFVRVALPHGEFEYS